MKTNLIFKRSVTDTTGTRVETKIIPVTIPNIEAGSGWVLSGHTDTVEIVGAAKKSTKKETIEEEPRLIDYGESFISDVPGTAKLVRRNGRIIIAYRRGKKTYNQTTKNSVCISDAVKNTFFNEVKRVQGLPSPKEWGFADGTPEFTYWNNFIDDTYANQLKNYNDKVRVLLSKTC